jgi:alpha-1,3-glucan synthase
VIFPPTANYSRDVLHKASDGSLYVSHKATGADKFRYSLNWGSTYSDWLPYSGGNTTLEPKKWSGTSLQDWSGEHVILQYYSKLSGSSNYVQHADLGRESLPPRRFPHLFLHGDYNAFGFDAGLPNTLKLENSGNWTFNLMTEWPTVAQINEWGINPDGQPDQTGVYGDADGDNVLDRMPPSQLSPTVLNITKGPPAPYLAWKLSLRDGDLRYEFLPIGNRWRQMALYIMLWVIPVLTGALGVWAFLQS